MFQTQMREARQKRQVEITEIDGRLNEEYEEKLQASLQELRDQYEQQMNVNREDIKSLYERKVQNACRFTLFVCEKALFSLPGKWKKVREFVPSLSVDTWKKMKTSYEICHVRQCRSLFVIFP